MQFEHFNISAPQGLLEQVKDFYLILFELELGFRPDFPDQGYWLYFKTQPVIHLSQDEMRQGANDAGYLDHIAFRLEGIERFTQKLSQLNIPYKINPVPQLNMQQVFLHDPTGIKLEINFVNEGKAS